MFQGELCGWLRHGGLDQLSHDYSRQSPNSAPNSNHRMATAPEEGARSWTTAANADFHTQIAPRTCVYALFHGKSFESVWSFHETKAEAAEAAKRFPEYRIKALSKGVAYDLNFFGGDSIPFPRIDVHGTTAEEALFRYQTQQLIHELFEAGLCHSAGWSACEKKLSLKVNSRMDTEEWLARRGYDVTNFSIEETAPSVIHLES